MDLIYPGVFKQADGIEAVFTKSNRELVHTERRIPGLNLGTNTGEELQVIKHNTRTLFEYLNWNPDLLAAADQVHGTHVQAVEKPGVYAETDGLVTNKPGIVLGIRVADCAAVLIAGPQNKVIGAFHAGWKGAAGGIIPKGIKMMKKLSGKPGQFRAFISPCISKESFEVGEEVAARFPAEFVDRKNFKKPHVDLKAYISAQLAAEGVGEESVEVSDECTMQNDCFFSYRREKERAGRMLGLITLNPDV